MRPARAQCSACPHPIREPRVPAPDIHDNLVGRGWCVVLSVARLSDARARVSTRPTGPRPTQSQSQSLHITPIQLQQGDIPPHTLFYWWMIGNRMQLDCSRAEIILAHLACLIFICPPRPRFKGPAQARLSYSYTGCDRHLSPRLIGSISVTVS